MINLIKLFFKYRKIFVINTFLAVSIALILFFTLPRRYKATSEIIPTLEPEIVATIGTSLIMSNPLLSFLVTPADIYARILKSRCVIGQLVDKLGLVEKMGARNREALVKKLQRSLIVKTYPEGLIEVSFEHKDKELAVAIVNTSVSLLDSINKYTLMTKGKELRRFLEQRLKEVKEELETFQDSLRSLQESYNFVNLEEEYKSFIGEYITLYADLFKEKIETEFLKEIYGEGSSTLFQKEKKIQVLQKKLRDIFHKGGFKDGGYGPGFAIPVRAVPSIFKKYVTILAEIEARKEAYSFIFAKYEEAKIMEKKDTPTLTILSYATLPQLKSWPRGSRMLLIAVFIALMVSVILVFIEENEQIQELLEYMRNAIREDLSFFRRKG